MGDNSDSEFSSSTDETEANETAETNETGTHGTGADETGAARAALSRRAARFTVAQRAFINAYYSKGMTGTGRKHKHMIRKAANDAGLSTPQIKVEIKV